MIQYFYLKYKLLASTTRLVNLMSESLGFKFCEGDCGKAQYGKRSSVKASIRMSFTSTTVPNVPPELSLNQPECYLPDLRKARKILFQLYCVCVKQGYRASKASLELSILVRFFDFV